MKFSALRFVLGAALAIFLSLSASAQTQLGRIKAARVTGEVTKTSSTGQTSALANGLELIESDTITTGKNSSVVLIFENASTVRIGADSKLAITTFKVDPLDEVIEPSKLTKEPTKSVTQLDLTYGELVGDVKKLNTSSTYSIKTPVGAAGIRGTQFRIVFRPTSDGKAFTFTLSTAEGLVVFEGSTSGSGADVGVGEGQEVIVNAEVAADGSLVVSAPASAQSISAEAQSQINSAIAQSTEAMQTTSFSASGGAGTDGTPPPPPVPPQPSTTPGSGGT
ncbi:FecR family protein [Oleiharenicola lentus]|uniref:FecR family protein n=1 Tax=Oleiharenicola lentus TaxID=2508720 RepID=UPI003F66EBD9